jgi:hypothetical protein
MMFMPLRARGARGGCVGFVGFVGFGTCRALAHAREASLLLHPPRYD